MGYLSLLYMASFTYCVEYVFHHWNIIIVTVDRWWEIKNWFLHLTLYTSWRWAHVWLSVSEIWVSALCMCVFVCMCACMSDRHAHTQAHQHRADTDTHIHTHAVYLSLCQCVHVCECSLVCMRAYKCTCKSTHVCLTVFAIYKCQWLKINLTKHIWTNLYVCVLL